MERYLTWAAMRGNGRAVRYSLWSQAVAVGWAQHLQGALAQRAFGQVRGGVSPRKNEHFLTWVMIGGGVSSQIIL